MGERRTAEELGRAFPQTPVVQSSGDHPVSEVGAEPALVLATPGVEPIAADGYAAALLLDAELLLARADLRAAEEALRRWLAAVALDGAQVLLSTAIAADPVPDTKHALIAAPEPPVGSRQVTLELGAPSAAGASGALVNAIAEAGRRQRLPGEGCVIIVGYRLWDHGLLALHKTAQRQGGRCPRLPEVAWVDIAPYVPVTARGERPSLLDACGRFGLTFSDDAGSVAEAIGGLTLCLRMFGYMPPLCEAAESQRELSLRLFRAEQIALC